jgi:carbonic anhydrase/acetyltransferase-like protein (isoleucine patch superfamily)
MANLKEKGIKIAPSAVVTGQVFLGRDVSIWHHATLRGDINEIHIGEGTNIQDNVVVHVSYDQKTIIGKRVTIGHSAIIHGCHIHDDSLIGMGAIVLDGAIIEPFVLVGAGSLVAPNKHLESGFLYLGSPVKKIRSLTDEEKTMILENANHYLENKSQL